MFDIACTYLYMRVPIEFVALFAKYVDVKNMIAQFQAIFELYVIHPFIFYLDILM